MLRAGAPGHPGHSLLYAGPSLQGVTWRFPRSSPAAALYPAVPVTGVLALRFSSRNDSQTWESLPSLQECPPL